MDESVKSVPLSAAAEEAVEASEGAEEVADAGLLPFVYSRVEGSELPTTEVVGLLLGTLNERLHQAWLLLESKNSAKRAVGRDLLRQLGLAVSNVHDDYLGNGTDVHSVVLRREATKAKEPGEAL